MLKEQSEMSSVQLHPIFNEERDTWVFDLDNTLYPAECNLFAQMDVRMGAYIQRLLDLDPIEARKVQKGYLVDYGTTLKGLMIHHGVDPHHYLDDVHDIDVSVVPNDPNLANALDKLEGRKLIFTNADLPYAERVLDRLGIKDKFEDIFDIHEADLTPKPQQVPYDKFVSRYGIDPQKSVMVEDMVRNLIPAHNMGMACVWVNTGLHWGKMDHMEDVVHAETNSLSNWLSDFVNRP